MSNVIVQAIIQGPVEAAPFSSNGKMIQVTEWLVNALVDGVPMQNIKLRAFSKKVHWCVMPGNPIVCDPPKTHNGQIEYKITTPSDANGKVNTQRQAPAAPPSVATPPPFAYQGPLAGQPPKSTPPKPQPLGYNQEELEDVMLRAYTFAKETMGDSNLQAVASFAATYIIAATREGIKMKNPLVEKHDSVDAVMAGIWKIIEETDLMDRTVSANITDVSLKMWYEQAGKDANAFCIRLKYELNQIESAQGDE